jgi:prepilin-type N-terminal cleavage/methylation domain-containing protein
VRRSSYRSGFSITEVLVASAIFALLVGAAMRTVYINRRAVDTTARVGALQEVRGVLTQVTHDLQVAVAIEQPGWASASNTLEYLDDRSSSSPRTRWSASGVR